MLSLLGLSYDKQIVKMAEGEHKSADYLKNHPFGQVPLFQEGETFIWDSNAILVYLAKTYDTSNTWYPNDAMTQAQIQQWFSISAGPLLQGPAFARAVKLFQRPLDYDKAVGIATQLFDTMDKFLAGKTYLVGENATLADIAMYSYVAEAPVGEIDLSVYPNIQNWLKQIEQLDGFVALNAG